MPMNRRTLLTVATLFAAALGYAPHANDSSPALDGAARLQTLPTPFPITWTTSKMTVSADGNRTYVAKGTDSRGSHSELVFTETSEAFAGSLWTNGRRLTAHGRLGDPVRFQSTAAAFALPCLGGGTVDPNVELLHDRVAGHAGGIAGANDAACIDAETVDVLMVYSGCGLEQYAAAQNPPIPDPMDALPLLKAECANAIDAMNMILDASLVSTPARTRHLRLRSLQALTPDSNCQAPNWDPDPPNPIFGCNQLADPEAGTGSIWCGEETAFSADLAVFSDPSTPFGGLIDQYRTSFAADLVVVLRVASNPPGDASHGMQKSVNSGCNGASGFSVVDITAVDSVIHEWGHNFGCCHEPGAGGVYTCSLFPYSFAHRFFIPDGTTFPPPTRTLMAMQPGTAIPRFSNPEVLFPPGNPNAQPTGTGQTQFPYWSDNARTIRETFDDVRCYRCADLPPPPPPAGPVVCFGSNSHGQSATPGSLLACTDVAAGHLHTVALQQDGMVRAWGAGTTMTNLSPNYGQSMVPLILPDPPYGDGDYLGTCSGVAAGLYHSVAIRMRGPSDPLDGVVVCWGAGRVGQFASPHYNQSAVPGNLGPCVKVAAGHYHTLALGRDAGVSAWGAGATPFGPWPHLGQSAVPDSLGPCLDIAAGGYHSLAIQRGGLTEVGGPVVAWGAGQSNSGSYSEYGQSIVPTLLGNCTAVAAGVFHSVGLKADGTVQAWGAGMTNTNTFPNYGQSIVPGTAGVCTAISAGGSYLGGGSHTLVIKSNESLAAWGAGTVNSGVTPHFGQANPPALPATGWVKVSAGGLHSAAIVEPVPAAPCDGDLNLDRVRNGLDLAVIFSAWGTPSGDCTGDGFTDGADMTLLLSGWGNCP